MCAINRLLFHLPCDALHLDIAAAIIGGTLSKAGAGTLRLDGAADNTGLQLAAEAGTVVLAKASAAGVHAAAAITDIATGATVMLAGTGGAQIPDVAGQGVAMSGGTLDLDGQSPSLELLTGTGIVTNSLAGSATTITVGSDNASFAFDGLIRDGASGGTVALVKAGTGTLTLGAQGSSYSGGTTIAAGQVTSDGGGTLGTGPVSLAGGTLDAATTAPSGTGTVTGFGVNGQGWSERGATGPMVVNDILTVTNNQQDEARAAWYNTPVDVDAFTVQFTYTPSGSIAADGMAFVLQNDPNGTVSLGDAGGGLGYQGIADSLAVGLNLYNGHTIGYGIFTGGTGTGTYSSVAPVVLNSGNPIDVTVSYDGTTLFLTLAEENTSHTFTASQAIDLASVLGGSSVSLGFTGGTGTVTSTQQISDFSYANYASSSAFANTIQLATGATATLLVRPAAGQTAATFGA